MRSSLPMHLVQCWRECEAVDTVVSINRTEQRPQQLSWVRLECATNKDEFYNVQSSLSAFIFGDEGLRLAQHFGKFVLSQACLFPRLYHQLPKSALLGGMN